MKVRFRPPDDPAVVNGIRAPYAPAKRSAPPWRWYLLLLLVGSPLLWFIATSVWRAVNIVAPGYVSLDHVDVRPPAGGVVSAIRVAVGTPVRAGDVIAVVSNPVLEAQRDDVRAQLAAYDAPSSSAASDALERRRVADAQARLATYTRLEGAGAATVADVNTAQDAVAAAQADLLRARTDPNAVALRARLAGLEAQTRAQAAVATVPGDIVALDVRVGDTVDPGDTLATVGLADRPHVLAFLDPRDEGAANEGERGTVTFPTGQRVRAHVTKISRLAHPLPATFVSPLATRTDTIELTLDLDGPGRIPAVNGLPVSVHLDGMRL